MRLTRRALLAGGTVAAGLAARKPARAAGRLQPVIPPIPAPETPFTTADGKPRRLADYAGKKLVVDLWATWCPPCVKELPSLSVLARTLAADGFAVLPISADLEGAPRVEAFFKAHGIGGLPVLLDRQGDLMRAFQAVALPTTYVLDARTRIVAMETGGMDWARPDVAAELRKLATI